MRVYLDNCSFNRPYDNQSQVKIHLETEAKLFIQQKILDGEYELVWSYMLDFENNANPFEERRNSIAALKKIATVDCVANRAIVEGAKKLLIVGIKARDALHIMCAIDSNCDYFITTDAGVLNKSVDGIKIVDPIDFIKKEIES